MNNFQKYLLVGAIVLTIIDYTTAFNPDYVRWINHMPPIWLFYLGWPLIFSIIIYKFKFTEGKVLLLTIIGALFFEIVLFNNSMLYTMPIMIIAIPIGFVLYSLIVFLPKWIVEDKLKENKWKIVLMASIWILISMITFINNSK